MDRRRLSHLQSVAYGSLDIWKENEERVTHQIYVPDGYSVLAVQPKRRGTVLGNHYHSGLTTEKDPEILYIISGEWRLQLAEVVNGAISGPIYTSHETKPIVYFIGRHTWHRLVLLSTHGMLIEFAPPGKQPEDTFAVSNSPAVAPP